MMGFRFQDPVWLLAMIPVVAFVLFDARRRGRSAVLYSSVQILKSLPRTMAQRVKGTLTPIALVGLLVVTAALARPQHGREEFRIRTEGIAIEMVCDISGSMQAIDFREGARRVDRLSVVKRVFRDFVAGTGGLDGRGDDLIGLIAFGGYADSRCPLTLDHGALLQILESLEIPKPVLDSRGRMINEGLLQDELKTAIGDGMALGVARLKDAAAKSKVLILLSDGADNFRHIPPLDAAAAAAAFGVKVYAVGIGSTGYVDFPMEDVFGRTVIEQRLLRLDEELLKEIAEKTGGKYFNARETESLEEVYAEIDALEKTETEGHLYTEYRELYQYFLFAGAVLFVLQLLLRLTFFRSLP